MTALPSPDPADLPTADFIAVVKEFLPPHMAEAELKPDTELAQYGLDSMNTISLMLKIEEDLEITFPDESLSAESFATLGTLWRTVSDIRRQTV